MRKKYNKMIILGILLILLTSLIAELLLFNLYGHRTIIEGEIEGDFEFVGESEIEIDEHYLPYGKNWNIKITNIVTMEHDVRNGTIYNTTELTITSSRYGGSFQKGPFVKISNGNGKCIFTKLRNRDQGPWLDLELDVKEAYSYSELSDGFDFDVRHVTISTDNETFDIYDTLYNSFVLHSNETMVMNINAFEGSHFSKLPGTSYFPNPLILNGTLSTTRFKGVVTTNGRLYSTHSFSIEATEIKVYTNQKPHHDPSPRYATNWEVEIEFEDGRIVGIYLPYWGIGTIIGVISTPLIFKLHAWYHRKYGKRKSKKG